MVISAPPGALTVVIEGQTVTMEGGLATLSNHDVLSYGPSGIVIQMPGGGVSTVTMGMNTTAPDSSVMPSSSKAIGSIIASIGGMGNSTTEPTTFISSPPTQLPAVTTSSTSRIYVSTKLRWVACGLGIWSVYWF